MKEPSVNNNNDAILLVRHLLMKLILGFTESSYKYTTNTLINIATI